MKLEKIPTKTLRQMVYDQLRSKIVSAEILPGQILTLRGLSKELGVSFIPIREALFQLESEKVIVIESNKSIHVNKLTPSEMEEALQIRVCLESMAAEKACEFRPENALPKVKQLLEDMRTSIKRPEKYLLKNSEFHLEIYSYANSPMLLQHINLLWARVGPYIHLVSRKGSVLSGAMKCHQGMYEAFATKNKKKMREFLRRDLGEAARAILTFL